MLRLQCTPRRRRGRGRCPGPAARQRLGAAGLGRDRGPLHHLAPLAAEWDALLLDKLAGTRRIVGISAYAALHVFAGMTTGWPPVTAREPREAGLQDARPTSRTCSPARKPHASVSAPLLGASSSAL